MIKVGKVFLIIGMVFQAILIYPIVLGIIALKKLDEARNVSDITGWGIVSLIFVNLIGGILLLCAKDADLVEYQASRGIRRQEQPQSNVYCEQPNDIFVDPNNNMPY